MKTIECKGTSMTEANPIVFIVDDDESVRKALARLITSVGLKVEAFSSAIEFLKRDHYDGPSCLVLDIRMPGLSGLDLQAELAKAQRTLSIVFITGHGNIPMSVQAIKAGAVDFLEKPFDEQALLDAVHLGIQKDRAAKENLAELKEIQECVESLTPREREVFALVVTGMLNKQIAFEMGISEKTIKVHRARVMQKMQAESLADLVRLAEKAGVKPVTVPPKK
jgi:RNA polymerase sigma factor (sigma-70 family)